MVANSSKRGAGGFPSADSIGLRAEADDDAGKTLVHDDAVGGRHGDIPIRRYLPAKPSPGADTVVWLHGGSFSHGGLDQLESHAPALRLAAAGHTVITVDYRRVPPWSWARKPRPGILEGIRFPIPVDDVIDAFLHVRDKTADGLVTLGGASAGACLAAGATLRLRGENRPGPARLMLAYGTFHAALPPIQAELRSRTRGRHGFMQFRPGTVEKMNRNYAGSLAQMNNPEAFPGGHDLIGFPPTLFVDADRDSLRASGSVFARELVLSGVPVKYEIVAEATHGFLNRPGTAHFSEGMDFIGRWLASQPGK